MIRIRLTFLIALTSLIFFGCGCSDSSPTEKEVSEAQQNSPDIDK